MFGFSHIKIGDILAYKEEMHAQIDGARPSGDDRQFRSHPLLSSLSFKFHVCKWIQVGQAGRAEKTKRTKR